MMKLQGILSILFLFVASFNLDAQKFGHINSALLIEQHPKVSVANAQLESFQKVLSDSFAIKVKAFEDKYRLFMEEASKGTLSQVASQNKQVELQAEQQALSTEEQQLKFRILQKREQLLKPILSEVDEIIQAIGKEGNYTMIFDVSVAGGILFAEQGEDLTEMIKSRCVSK